MTFQPETVGFIGIGLMGRPMALRLLAADARLVVWGRTPGKLRDVLAAGAEFAEAPAAVAQRASVVITCVSDTAAVEAVVFGPCGVAEGGSAGKVLVDMSTIQPRRSRELAEQLRAQTGMGWVDAPVSGGPSAAAAGTLAVMAGGDPADFERVEPVLRHLAGGLTLMGPPGAGQTTKMVNQVIVGGCKSVIAEAIQLAMNAGLDARRLPEALAGGRADSVLLRQSIPKMVSGDFSPAGRLRTVLKDLDLVMELAGETGTPMPMTGLATQLHRMMITHGHADSDSTAVIALLRDRPLL
ncbi:NAD(P)-binding domain-containing protein [Kribbella shirazensis]|uniref:NAD(P)-binding domain-containing protein n=1 Tax=Kribbella shirazensis TaxID=1105143 RepID=UPI00192DC666